MYTWVSQKNAYNDTLFTHPFIRGILRYYCTKSILDIILLQLIYYNNYTNKPKYICTKSILDIILYNMYLTDHCIMGGGYYVMWFLQYIQFKFNSSLKLIYLTALFVTQCILCNCPN